MDDVMCGQEELCSPKKRLAVKCPFDLGCGKALDACQACNYLVSRCIGAKRRVDVDLLQTSLLCLQLLCGNKKVTTKVFPASIAGLFGKTHERGL